MPLLAGRLGLRTLCAFAILATALGVARAEKPAAPDDAAINLDQSIQALKDEVVQFNRDAEMAQDEFLYPPHSRLVVYVSNKIPGLLLHDLKLTVDDGAPVIVTYDDDSSRAMLAKNALQPVTRANIQRGAHRLRAEFTGQLGNAKEGADPVTGSYEAIFDKSLDPAELELQIVKGAKKTVATMQLKVWRAEE